MQKIILCLAVLLVSLSSAHAINVILVEVEAKVVSAATDTLLIEIDKKTYRLPKDAVTIKSRKNKADLLVMSMDTCLKNISVKEKCSKMFVQK